MKKHKIKVGKTTYSVMEASAVDQRELLTIVGRIVAFHKANSEIESIDADLLVGSMMTMSNEIIAKIDDLVLGSVVDDQDITVDVKTFQGRMSEYMQLLAHAIKINLDDFFDYLPSGKSASAGQ